MAIWKKQNKEKPACRNEKEKVSLSDENMEKVSGGSLPSPTGGYENVYTERITTPPIHTPWDP